MTERLYYRDAMLLSFDATVTAHSDGDPRRVILDRTAFYPTSGGQPHDTGMLGDCRVIDVTESPAGIVHLLDSPLGAGPVRGDVDADRRRDHMVQHTAQHLLSAIAEDRFGWHTESVHFGPGHSAIEFDTSATTDEELGQLEEMANAALAEARQVIVTFENPEHLTGLRKPTARTGEVRVVTIEGIDRSACGGTHVSRTSEIGAIAMVGSERVRSRCRVAFIAGERVRRRLHANEELLRDLALRSACAVDELADLVTRRRTDLADAVRRIEVFDKELAAFRIAALLAAEAPGPDGIRRVVHRATDESAESLRAMAHAVGNVERAIFVATVGTPPTIVVGTTADSGVDAGAFLKAALAAAGGRGGGSARFAQGTVPDPARLREIVQRLMN